MERKKIKIKIKIKIKQKAATTPFGLYLFQVFRIYSESKTGRRRTFRYRLHGCWAVLAMRRITRPSSYLKTLEAFANDAANHTKDAKIMPRLQAKLIRNARYVVSMLSLCMTAAY